MIWLSYNEKYEISDDGQVRHKKFKRILKHSYNLQKYHQVNLKPCKQIHRMVGERVLPKIDIEGLTIDHIDQDKSNNNASNLRWVSRGVQQRNQKVRSNNFLGEKHISPNGKKFRVHISKDGMRLHYVNYETLPEAIAARDLILNSIEYNS